MHEVSSVESLNTSVNIFYQIVKGAKKDEELSDSAGSWIDVRDVAQAHLRAIQVENAGGSRYIISAGMPEVFRFCPDFI
jgi:nucleoside-diphosphate-sugar epimerase